jgi:hypothetical protein
MTDPDEPNQAYRLARRIDAARETADTSIDPADHMVKNALQGVADAEIYAIERAAHDLAHGVPSPDDFPPWSAVSEAGTYSWPGEFERIEIDPRLDNP